MLDAESNNTVRRFAVLTAAVVAFSMLQNPELQKRVALSAFNICSVVAAVIALRRRERLFGPTLNRWDEAIAFIGARHLFSTAL
jgi:hypothetical protein